MYSTPFGLLLQKYIIKRILEQFGNNNLQKLANQPLNCGNKQRYTDKNLIIYGMHGFGFVGVLPSYYELFR
jgi:hypothetical protein